MFAPEVQVTLIESHQKKATFLKELVYALGLKNVRVFSNRAESYPETADLVMLRAVERFEQALQMAVQLTKAGGRMALMIGAGQVGLARKLVAEIDWCEPAAMPGSQSRELLLGTKS